MLGDNVAAAGVEVATMMLSKTTELIFELMKIEIDRQRNAMLSYEEKPPDLQGEVSYRELLEGGEVTMLPSFAKEDYGELLKRAKKLGIPVTAMQEQGKENTLSVFINVKNEQAVSAIVQDILQEKLRQPEQTERMLLVDKDQVEALQIACAAQDIPVNFMEAQDGVKCIFHAGYEMQMQAVVEDFRQMQAKLSHTSVQIGKDQHGKPQIIIEDTEQGKQLTMHFTTKARLERVLREQLGFSDVKAVQTANALMASLTEEQRKFYLSSSRMLEQADFFEPHIRLDNENILTEPYSFAKLKLANEETPRLTITSGSSNFVVLSGKSLSREDADRDIRQYLKVSDSEVVKAILDKAEKLGFVEAPCRIQYKEYLIERDSQSTFTVRGGSTEVRLNLDDKLTARKQLMDSFGMPAAKADKIIAKAQKQSVAKNLLHKAKYKKTAQEDTLRHKKRERGSRK